MSKNEVLNEFEDISDKKESIGESMMDIINKEEVLTKENETP